MKTFELMLCGLLALGGLAHLGGTLAGYDAGTEVFAWSISASAFVLTIVFLHLVRIGRPRDRPIAAGAIITKLVWVAIALAFGHAIGNIAAPRVVMHVVVALALVATASFGWRSAGGSALKV